MNNEELLETMREYMVSRLDMIADEYQCEQSAAYSCGDCSQCKERNARRNELLGIHTYLYNATRAGKEE